MFTSQIEMLIHSRQSLGKTRLYMAPGVASKPQGEIVFIGVVIATVMLMLGYILYQAILKLNFLTDKGE